MKTLLLSIFGSALVAVVYALVFAQREAEIREYLRTSARGLLRWLYIRALLGAVRGDAAVSDARNLAVIICLIIFATSTTVSWISASIQRENDSNGATIEQLYKDFDRKGAETRDDLRAQLTALKAKQEASSPSIKRFTWISRLLAKCLYAGFVIGWIVWVPYVKLRTRFAHEVSRFSLRIQGLATQQELADLTAQELRVRGSESLRQYVELMRNVAAAKGIVGLTKTFELWDVT